MDTNTLLIAGKLINQFADFRTKAQMGYCNNIDLVLTQNTINSAAYIDTFKKASIELAPQFEGVVNQIREMNRLTSAGFNLIKFFSPGETMHSRLVGYLLNPRAAHGQKNLFLTVFLEKLGIENSNRDQENWIVTAETGRIDILLKRRNPHSVVIIENKSNLATDQPNQLYRYWYQEIYKTKFHEKFLMEDLFNLPSEYYQLLYLVPEHWKTPSDNSLSRPPELDNLSLPDKVPMKPKIIIYRVFIADWLNECLLLLPENNYRIREFVKQYIEFWT